MGLSLIPSIGLFLLGKPTEAFSIITGGLISLFNLFLLLRNQGKGFLMFTRYIILSFVVFFLLYFGFSPIFLAIGFTIFPLSMALSVIKSQESRVRCQGSGGRKE